MIQQEIRQNICAVTILFLLWSCQVKERVEPVFVTDQVTYDTDDPAIWVNRQNHAESIIFGTDKETDGSIYAFDLKGKIIPGKRIRDIKRPNNVDVEYGFRLNDSTETDIIAWTERERKAVRIYSCPDLMPLDNGGYRVFEGAPVEEDDWSNPMGIGLFKHPETSDLSMILSRKSGPTDGTYLWQYAIEPDNRGNVQIRLVRKFGTFSGKKEIEALAVDDRNGYVYYSDEGVGIRKYYADPSKGDEELALFGGKYFHRDQEGIAIHQDNLIVSDQSRGALQIFDTGNLELPPKRVYYQANETDGIEIYSQALGLDFPNGILVAMSDDRTFHYYDLAVLLETAR